MLADDRLLNSPYLMVLQSLTILTAILLLPVLLTTGCVQVNVSPPARDSVFAFPERIGWVNDFDGVLDQQTESELSVLSAAHEDKTSEQVVVVTLASVPPNTDIRLYTNELGNVWGVGKEDDGKGVVIMASRTYNYIYISVGKALLNKLTDPVCLEIMQNTMGPWIRNNDYDQALLAGEKEVVRILEAPEN
jgi:uncharacterized protein